MNIPSTHPSDFLLKFCCRITLNDYDIVKRSSAYSRKQIKREALSLAIPVSLWLFMGTTVAFDHTHNLPTSLLIGALLATFIGFIDMLIVSNQSKSTFQKGFRVVLAFILAAITASLADRVFLRNDITGELIKLSQSEALANKILIRENWEKSNSILLDNIEQAELTVAQAELDFNNEISGVHAPRGYGVVAKVKEARLQSHQRDLDHLHKQQQASLEGLEDRVNLMSGKVDEKYLNPGPLLEAKALISLVRTDNAAMITYIIFLSLMLSLELFVISTKVGVKTDYQELLQLSKEVQIRRVNLYRDKLKQSAEKQQLIERAHGLL